MFGLLASIYASLDRLWYIAAVKTLKVPLVTVAKEALMPAVEPFAIPEVLVDELSKEETASGASCLFEKIETGNLC